MHLLLLLLPGWIQITNADSQWTSLWDESKYSSAEFGDHGAQKGGDKGETGRESHEQDMGDDSGWIRENIAYILCLV